MSSSQAPMTQAAILQRGLRVEECRDLNKRARTMFIRVCTILSVTLLLFQLTLGASAANDGKKRIGFTVRAAPWTMTLPAHDFVVREEKIKPDGRYGYFYLTDEKQRLNVSFFIEPADKCGDSKSCRDMVWKAGNPSWENPQNIVLSEIGQVSVFEFLMPSLRGVPFQQQNMYAQFVVDGFWVDLHMSKVLYKPEERKLFENLVKAIKFEPKGKKAGS